MSQILEADVALLHIVGGGARLTSPPGTLAQTAPRRSARGRDQDYFFINLNLRGASPASPSHLDHLASLASAAYYTTPGSVTAAMREAIAALNDQVIDSNQTNDQPAAFQGYVLCAVLRGMDLYIGQSGLGQAVLVRPGTVTRMTSEEAEARPLGISLTPHIRYYHLEVKPSDLLILTTSSSEIWSDATLSGLSTLELDQAVDRLVAASDQDLTGILARIVPQGAAGMQPVFSGSDAPPAPPAEPVNRVRSSTVGMRQPRTSVGLKPYLERLQRSLASFYLRGLTLLSSLISRIAPGLSEPLEPDALSRRILIGTSVVVPLIIVAIAALIYYGRGRGAQFDTYLDQAIQAAALAQTRPSQQEARADWEQAMRMLELAANYGESPAADELHLQVQGQLDQLNLVKRLNFLPVVRGGFGTDADITAVAASDTDLFVLDSAQRIIRHAWGAPERGFEIDSTFDCLGPSNPFPELGQPIDIVLQPAPGALGAEGIVAIDGDGTLLYCAPDRQPALAQLTTPDLGWGRIQAIDVYGESLYVLDPVLNAVWIYEATGGLFSGNPELYFVEEVRDLKGAVDLALAQDELVILYADGRLDRCRRTVGARQEDGSRRLRVECDAEPYFQDERLGFEATAQIPGAVPVEMSYSAPPEPALYFLDLLSNSVFHYSMRLVYQGQLLPLQPFEGEISAMTLGPPNDLYLAVGSQIYHARPE
jgi:hypothetical protein